MRARIGSHRLDLDRYRLTWGDDEIELEPKPLQLLVHLVRRHPSTVSRDELFESLWPDTQVTDASLTRAVHAARSALGSDGRRIVETVRGHGYRLGVPVEFEEGDRPGAPPLPPPASPEPWVGRTEVLETLEEALSRARSGSAQIALLTGEPGIGKTRTAEELAARADLAGFEVLRGRSSEGEGAPALWPWTRILQTAARSRSPAALRAALGPGAADVAALVPEIRERLPRLRAAPRMTSAEARFQLFDAVAGFLARASSDRPLMLVFDDLHWADPTSLLLLSFVARELSRARVLILATYRNVETDSGEALDEAIASLLRLSSGPSAIELVGFSPEEVAQLAEAMGVQVDDAAALQARTAGNPLFTREVLRHGIDAADVGAGLLAHVRTRLRSLDKDTRELLELASVVGREVPEMLLVGASDTSDAEVRDHLERAARAGFLEEVRGRSPAAVRFTHDVVRETIYSSVERRRRRQMHGRVGAALERSHGSAHQLAHHFSQAELAEPAIRYSTAAAADAARTRAYEEAVRLHRVALGFLGTGSGAKRADILLLLGDAESGAGEVEAARASFVEAFEIARSQDDAELMARAVTVLIGAVAGGYAAAPADCVDRVREVLGRGSSLDAGRRAELVATLARARYWTADPDELDRLSREAVELARKAADPGQRLAALETRHQILLGYGDRTEARAITTEMLEIARRSGDPYFEMSALVDRVCDAVHDADPAEIDALIRRTESLTERVAPRAAGFVEGMRTARHLWRGELDEAERGIERMLAIAPRTLRIFVQHALTQQVALHWQRGDLGSLEATLRDAALKGPKALYPRCALTLLLCEKGDLDAARAEYEELSAGGFGRLRRDSLFAVNAALLAEICVALEDPAGASLLFDLMSPWSRRYVAVGHFVALGSGDRYLANLAALGGRDHDAELHYGLALEIERRMGARPWIARTLADRRRSRIRSGNPPGASELDDATAS